MISKYCERLHLREIHYLLGDDRKKIPWLILLFLASSMLDLAGLGLIGPYVALVVNPENLVQGPIGQYLSKIGISQESKDLLIIVGLGLMGIFLIKAIVAIFINSVILRFSWNRQTKLRTYLMQSYQQLPYTKYLQRNSSEYIQTIQTFVSQFATKVLQSLLRILSEGIVALVVLALLACTNGPALALLVTLIGGMVFTYDRLFRSNVIRYGERANAGGIRMVKGIQEGIEGLKEIRILGKTIYFQQMVSESALEVSRFSVKASIISTAPRYLLEFILVAFVVLFVIGSLTFGGDVQALLVPTLSVFGVASLRLLPSANQLIGGITQIRYGRHAISRLYADLKHVENHGSQEPVRLPNQDKVEPFSILSLNGLNFRYPNTKQWVLKEVTMSIKAGESIGLIGPSGAGKTTLVDILLGLLEPQEGEILCNNRSLNSALPEWRAQVAYLPQEVFIIDNTLRRNVALGLDDSKIDELRLQKALRQTRLTELVEQLPQGVDTLLGERGVRLSGGQRQRVALARAFYHERSVIVMDEATSSLDQETEREIVEEIKHIKAHKTLIVIAHRLTTVQHCDRIYRLDKGRIMETGSYDQVINKRFESLSELGV